MVDFRKLMKNQGTKAVLTEKLPTLPAMQSEYDSDECTIPVSVRFKIRRGNESACESSKSWWIHLEGGPTGFESADLVQLLSYSNPDAVWTACMGSNKYRRLEVRIADIREAVRSYNVNYQFELI